MSGPATARCPHCFGAPVATPCPHCGWQPGQDNPPPALALKQGGWGGREFTTATAAVLAGRCWGAAMPDGGGRGRVDEISGHRVGAPGGGGL